MGKNRKNKNAYSQPVLKPSNQEYDLKSSLNKLHQKSSSQIDYTTQGGIEEVEQHSTSNFKSNFDNSTATLLGLDRRISDKYDKLKDDIFTLSNKNNEEHTTLKKELEDRIDKGLDKKLDYRWFAAAVAIILLLGGMIYTLSYSEIVSSTKNNASEIQKINMKIDKSESDIQTIKSDINELRKKK